MKRFISFSFFFVNDLVDYSLPFLLTKLLLTIVRDQRDVAGAVRGRLRAVQPISGQKPRVSFFRGGAWVSKFPVGIVFEKVG